MSDERTPGHDETHPMPPVDDATRVEQKHPSGGPRSDDRDDEIWSGRAEVRAPNPDPTEYYESDWADRGPAEPQGRWWAPIAVGSAALVLLALLGFGIAVIVRNTGDATEAPAPVVPATTATATTLPVVPEETVPTTQPTTTPPVVVTTTPTTEPAATELTVPALRGMPLADAQAALDRSGLTYRVIRRGSDAEPGTVIDSDPPEGRLVPSDTRITLVVAAEPTTGPASTTTAGEPDED